MRVTHVITRLIVGGAQENTIATVLGLEGFPEIKVDLVSGPTAGAEGSLESMFSSRPGMLRVVPDLVRPLRPVQDFKGLIALTRLFRQTQPDIVHTHSGKAGILGRYAAARARVPLIIHTIHGPSFGPWQGGFANLITRSAEKAAARITTHFVTVADAMTRQYLAAGIGSAANYTCIRSGFPLEPFLETKNDPALRARYKIPNDAIVAGKIARLFELKGHDDLLAAAPHLVKTIPRLRFLLVGGGDREEQFRARAREMGLEDYFIFTGLVPPAQIPGLVGIMDLLIHLSLREGLPRALPQAMAAGKPVIAYDCDGAPEVCLDAQTGFLVPAGNLPRLTSAIETLAADPELRLRFGEKGRQFVRERFSVQKMVSDIHRLYLELGRPAKRDKKC